MGKLQKFSRAFQVHVVACMCRIGFVMNRLQGIIDPEMFDDEILGEIIDFSLRHFHDTHELVSLVGMAEALSASEQKKIVREVWKEDISDPYFVIENVVDFARQQAIEKAVTEAAGMIDRGTHEGIIDLVRNALQVGEDFTDIGEYFHAGFDERAKDYLHPERIVRVRMGMGVLDECLGGGLEPGELGVILAPPKCGKSFTLVNIGYGASKGVDGVNVVHYSAEMAARKIQRRYDQRAAGRKINVYRESDPRQFIQRLEKRKNRIVKGEVLVKGYRTRQAGVSTLRAHLEQVRSVGFDFGLVIVDYGDILKPERRVEEMRHAQAGIFEDLRGLAGEMGVPIWTASQANRGSLSKDVVTMADIGESFEKIAIADAVIALCRTDEEKVRNGGRMFIAALRENAMGILIETEFDLANSIVRPLEIITNTIITKTGKMKKQMKSKEERKADGEARRERSALRRADAR